MAAKNLVSIIKQKASFFKTKKFLFVFLTVLLLISIFYPKQNLAKEWQKKKIIEEKILCWQKILKKYPGYRDIYLRLALLNWQINNKNQAKIYLQKAKELDPNFEKLKEIESLFSQTQ